MFHSRWLEEYALGVIIGFVLVSLLFFFELGMGFLKIEYKDITFSLLAGVFVAQTAKTVFQSASEELLFRGYLFQSLNEGSNLLIATGGTSILYGLGHLLVPHSSWIAALNLTLLGVFLALAYIRTKSLWLPSAIHFSWNFVMGNFYSLSVSGRERANCLLVVSSQGPEWLTGGEFGPEAGVPALLVLVAASFLIYRWKGIGAAPEVESLWKDYWNRRFGGQTAT
jgi:hypothetical protein